MDHRFEMAPTTTTKVVACWIALMALAGCDDAAATRVRVVHAATTAVAVEVWIDDRLTVSGLAAGDATDWIDASPGSVVSVTVGGISIVGAIERDGDHIAALTERSGSSALSIARVPPPARRGFELVVLGSESPVTIAVPDRPGLRVQTGGLRMASLVLPLDVDRIHVDALDWSRDVLLTDALRARGRVIVVPLGNGLGLPTWTDAPGLVVLDPTEPADRAAWILPPAPRVRGVVAVTGGSAALRVGDVDVPSCIAGEGCSLVGIDTGTRTTVSLVVPGSGAVIDALELEDLRPGEDYVVVATGDVRSAIRWITVPFRLSPRDPARTLAVVHAAPRLPPLAITEIGTGTSLGTVALGGHIEGPMTMPFVLSSGSEVVGVPLLAEFPALVIVTSATERLEDAETIRIIPTLGWALGRAPVEPR